MFPRSVVSLSKSLTLSIHCNSEYAIVGESCSVPLQELCSYRHQLDNDHSRKSLPLSTSTQPGEERDMGTETNEKSAPPQVVTLDKAFKLAERWVNNMTKVADEESEKTEPEPESRPSRLGLGAKVSHEFKPGPSADPAEKKLFYNLQAKKRREAQENEETATAANGDSDSEDDIGSRTAAFGKKRMPPPAVSLPTKKKKK